MSNYFFVLGAPDHEMNEIKRVCEEQGFAYGFATTRRGNIVHSHEAYDAHGVNALVPKNAHIVFVECSVMGLTAHSMIDHHHPGDPGYGMPPERYFEGSSIGQFLEFIGMRPTHAQLIIAAADHCLSAAYQGRCPGVNAVDLAAWRVESRSKARGLDPVELNRQIANASEVLQQAPRIQLAGVDVAFLPDPPMEVSEASARLGMPYVYVRKFGAINSKAGIRSAPAAVVKVWMEECGLSRLYGDPQRGFAGGYFATA